ncbi:hypothetical protein CFE70_003582 [Pyrenophora teres f. teres 0-1]
MLARHPGHVDMEIGCLFWSGPQRRRRSKPKKVHASDVVKAASQTERNQTKHARRRPFLTVELGAVRPLSVRSPSSTLHFACQRQTAAANPPKGAPKTRAQSPEPSAHPADTAHKHHSSAWVLLDLLKHCGANTIRPYCESRRSARRHDDPISRPRLCLNKHGSTGFPHPSRVYRHVAKTPTHSLLIITASVEM